MRAIPFLASVLTAALAATLAVPAPGVAAIPPAQGTALYLLAATPDIYGEYAFPVTLYKVGPGAGVERVRTIFTFAPGEMDVRADGRGRVYVVDENGLSIIHEAHPARNDLVMAPGPDSIRRGAPVTNWAAWGYWSAWGVVLGPAHLSGAVFADSRNAAGPGFEVVEVVGEPGLSVPRVSEAGWSAYRRYRYTGPGGGPYPEIPAGVMITAAGVQFGPTYHPGAGLVGQVPPAFPAAAGKVTRMISGPGGTRPVVWRSALVLLRTATFFAFRAPLPGMRNAWPKLVYVENRKTGKWFTLRLPYMHLPPRLFGDWLCTIVQRPNPDRRPSPGEQNERSVAEFRGMQYPNIRGAFNPGMYMPGILKLRNLKTGRVVEIHTGQQDSEVLGVAADGRVAYRVNSQIWVARMAGAGVGPAVLAAEGEDVPEVHWIFCRGGGDIGRCLPQPPAR